MNPHHAYTGEHHARYPDPVQEPVAATDARPTSKTVLSLKPMRFTVEAFDALPEYSHTLPTGQTPGKLWKRKARGRKPGDVYPGNTHLWVIGQYDPRGPTKNPSLIGGESILVFWYRPVVVLKPVRVKINGEWHDIALPYDFATYDYLVALAGMSGKPSVSHAYRKSGTLRPGQTLKLEPGMYMHIQHTGNA